MPATSARPGCFLCLGDDGIGIDITRGKDEHEAGLPSERGDRALDGVAQTRASRPPSRNRPRGRRCGVWLPGALPQIVRALGRSAFRDYRRWRRNPKLEAAPFRCADMRRGRVAALAFLVIALAVPASAAGEDAPFVGWSALLPGLSLPYDPDEP